MAVQLVNLVLNLYNGNSEPVVSGSATLVPGGGIQPGAVLQDIADGMQITQGPVKAPFAPAGLPVVTIIPTDAAGPQPTGWAWEISFQDMPGHVPPTFAFYVPAGPCSFTATHATPAVFTWTPTSAFTAAGLAPLPDGTGVTLSGGSLPGGFAGGTTYFVVASSGDTFELAATIGGSPVASTGTGSGTLAVAQYDLSALSPLTTVTALSLALPAPGGAAGSGQVPVATGTGLASEWTTLTAAAVDALPLPSGGSFPGGTVEFLRADQTWAVPPGGAGTITSVFGRPGPTVTAASGDYTVSEVTGAAPLASPAFTGLPTAPTQTPGDVSSKIASTSFVATAITAAVPNFGTASGTVAEGNDSRIVGAALAQTADVIGSVGSAETLNLANGLTQAVTLTANCSISFSNWPAGASAVTVIVSENLTGGWTPTFPGGVTWIGAPPAQNTAAAGISVYCFLTPNGGTTIWGAGVANSFAGPSSGDIFDWYTAGGSLVVWIDATGRAHFTSGLAVGSMVLAGSSVFGGDGNTVLNTIDTPGAVNFVDVLSSVTGTGPTLNADGPDTDIDLFLNPVGAGYIGINGPTTTSAPAGGAAGATPASPAGYLFIKIGGTVRQIAYY